MTNQDWEWHEANRRALEEQQQEDKRVEAKERFQDDLFFRMSDGAARHWHSI